MIRRAARRDSEPVAKLWLDLLTSQSEIDGRFAPSDDAVRRWKNDFPEWLDRDFRRIYVADEDGAVRGFIAAERTTTLPIYREIPEIYINELCVEPPFRGRGLGRDLLNAIKDWAAVVGARRLRAGALAANTLGRKFWEDAGATAFSVTYTLEVEGSEEPGSRRSKLGF